ncbi:unnamed protein product, partial [Linum tenue]
ALGAVSVSQGLRELADANRPKKRKAGRNTKAGSSSAPGTDVGKAASDRPSSTVPPVVDLAGPDVEPSAPLTRRAGKRVVEAPASEAAAKRARTSSPRSKAAGKRVDQGGSIPLSQLAATDTEAAEHGLHTISDWLAMPTEYTSTSEDNNRRLAGTAAQFFFAAQIGFSQIILLNDRLSKTVEDNAVEIANLRKSVSSQREAIVAEVWPEIQREFSDKLAEKEREVLAAKNALRRAPLNLRSWKELCWRSRRRFVKRWRTSRARRPL